MSDVAISVEQLRAGLRPEERDSWKPFFADLTGIEGEAVALSTVLQRRGIADALSVCRQFLDRNNRLDLCAHLLARVKDRPGVQRVSGLVNSYLDGQINDRDFSRLTADALGGLKFEDPRHPGSTDPSCPQELIRRACQATVEGDPATCGDAIARLLARPEDRNGSRLLPTAWTPVISDLLAWISAPPRVFKRWTPPPAPPTGPSSAQVSAVQMEIRRRKLEAMTIEELQALLADNAALARI